jgi:hypothetical protein
VFLPKKYNSKKIKMPKNKERGIIIKKRYNKKQKITRAKI